MAKHTLIIEVESLEELKAYVNAERSQMLIDGLYDEVFRPKIKYGENDVEVEYYEQIWERVNEYFNE